MRKAMVLLVIFGLAGSLWATDPFIGTWELNVSKSKFTPAFLDALRMKRPQQETIVFRDWNNDEMEVVVTGSFIDGSLNSQKYTVPKQGGIERSQKGGPPEGSYWIQIKISENEKYRTLLENGKQSTTLQHGVITQDGKTLEIEITGVSDEGKPFEGLYVFEKQ